MKLALIAVLGLMLSGCVIRPRPGHHQHGVVVVHPDRDTHNHCHDRGGKHHKRVCHQHPHGRGHH